ncbi:MAG: hypothetical protein DWQ34_12625 [Planctomycetota bacterium]|nr:MAG: hypothetical protein DWQ34_12625 [Planctomycetota bacterium]
MKSLRMRRISVGVAVTSVAGALLLSGMGMAAAKDKEADSNVDRDSEQKSENDLTPATTAARLALEGENRQSPLLLLAAAEILADLKASNRDADIESAASGDDTDGRLPPLEMDALIERARELAEGNEELQAAVETMIDTIESDTRGLVYRQGKDLESITFADTVYKVINTQHDRLDPGDELTLENVVFEGRKPAEIIVVGDGDGDLDLWVYDGNNGVLIDSDTDTTSVCIAEWTTKYEGPFTIVVKNVGSVWERFYVLANW